MKPAVKNQAAREKTSYISITASCDAPLKEAVENLASTEDRPVGAMARILIKEALAARGVEVPQS